ncbi:hypothetical protein T4B_8986 [Trichinella pseudospiralis]|uniref:Uncharacterized protein n=1 Tax=Trichinella pseudospiralis TaxID=6337 RepID=A0A0V1IAB3_TRIPS|nr:hypothetical protein T4B_8986 [Trichinella pseudospiralis]
MYRKSLPYLIGTKCLQQNAFSSVHHHHITIIQFFICLFVKVGKTPKLHPPVLRIKNWMPDADSGSDSFRFLSCFKFFFQI